MSNNPFNLLLRFLLELAILASVGWWGWWRGEGLGRWALAVGAPLLSASLWGIFRIPNDGGPPIVTVSGPLRLLIETVLFAAGILALVDMGHVTLAAIFAVVTLVHYIISHDRVRRMLKD